MKSLRYFTLFLLLVAMTLPPSSASLAAAPAKNLAPNPSFEKAQKGKSLPEGWSTCCTYASFSWVKGIAYDGKYSVSISSVLPHGLGVWQNTYPIPLEAGKSYTFSAYVKGDFNADVSLGQYSVDANGIPIGSEPAATATFNNSTWTYVELVFTPPTGAVGTYLQLLAGNGSETITTGTIYFDNVSLK